jgi:Tol biopolymer transport system component
MKQYRHVWTLVAIAAFSAVVVSQTPSGHALFEQALAKERVEGNLQEAITLYERVVTEFASDRALGARALVQIGLSYEKLGRDEAVRAYERLVREFADQKEAVAQARARLGALVRTASAPTPAGMTVQQLPDVKETTLAVAPDGTKAIVWDFSTGQNLAVYDFSRKQTRPLTDLDWSKGMINFAVWSPDSRRVTYQQVVYGKGTDLASELRVTTLDGRSSLLYRTDRVANPYAEPQPVGWTPDGATLIVVAGRPDNTRTLGTLPATGGEFTPLRSFGWSYHARDGSPRVSPDGRFIAYLEGEIGGRDVHVVSLDGRTGYRITNDPADDFAPIWSPDSRHLAFKSNRLGAVSMWTVEVKDGQPVGQPVKLKDGMQSASLIDWIERGIFYVETRNTTDLFTVPMDPVEERPTGSPRPISYWRAGRNIGPVWSPDGRRLAFISSAVGEPNRRFVVVMPAAGGQAREFLIPTTSWQNQGTPYDLRWFGNGRGLGLSGYDTRGTPSIFRLMLETGEWDITPLALRSPYPLIWAEWNHDGSAYYFGRVSLDGRNDYDIGIFERLVNGATERLVYRTAPATVLRTLLFSPDRKWLAFKSVTNTDGKTSLPERILVVDVRTGESRVLFTPPNDVTFLNLLSWTPSGDLLVHQPAGTAGTASEVLLLRVSGGPPRPFAMPSVAPGEPTSDVIARWSPDGKTMVLGRRSQGGDTFVIENPLAAIRTASASR